MKNIRLTTLCYIEKNDQYLMLYRNKKKDDQSEGKWLGVGGKLEENESPWECAVREIKEETGLTVEHMNACGVVTFISDIYDNELMFLFVVDQFSGDVKEVCEEGQLAWIDKKDVLNLPMWEGDRYFLKPLLAGCDHISLRLEYEGDSLVRHVDFVE